MAESLNYRDELQDIIKNEYIRKIYHETVRVLDAIDEGLKKKNGRFPDDQDAEEILEKNFIGTLCITGRNGRNICLRPEFWCAIIRLDPSSAKRWKYLLNRANDGNTVSADASESGFTESELDDLDAVDSFLKNQNMILQFIKESRNIDLPGLLEEFPPMKGAMDFIRKRRQEKRKKLINLAEDVYEKYKNIFPDA